ncbi:MAG TPA: cupin domain-containing protein [Candidatus Thermoplasmatota archaeon]|nr:cupin domain-containing protein [Candidatus Thermoplasmatota archaeon]
MFAADLSSHHGAFFRVLHTTARSQLAVMTIPPGEEAGEPERHETQDQTIVVLRGAMLARVWEKAEPTEVRGGPGFALVVPAGRMHWVKSLGPEPLFLATVYAPPAYPPDMDE